MDYSKLSDFEINKLVAESLGSVDVRQLKNMISEVYCEINGVRCFRDFCNNSADAWSIILENKIYIQECSGDWHSGYTKGGGEISVQHIYMDSDKNPLRAAMITFLKMNEK